MHEVAVLGLLGGKASGWHCDGSKSAQYVIEHDERARTCKFLMVTFKDQKVTSAEIVPGDTYGGIKRNLTTREEFLVFLQGKRF